MPGYERQGFIIFRGVFLNSSKYGLGYLGKAPTEGTPPTGPGIASGQLALNSTTNQQPTTKYKCRKRRTTRAILKTGNICTFHTQKLKDMASDIQFLIQF